MGPRGHHGARELRDVVAPRLVLQHPEGRCGCGCVAVTHNHPWLLLHAPIAVTPPLPPQEVSNSLIDKDDARFRAALWQFLLLVLGSSPLFALNRYLEDRFSLEWRRYMTEKALAKYFSGKAFFRLSLAGSAESAHAAHMDAGRRVDGERAVPNEQSGMVQPGLDNPDQRICNDIKSFTETSVTVCLVVIRNVSNSGRCRRRSLRIMPGVEHAFGTCAGIRQRRSEHGRGPSLVPAQWPSSPSCGRPRPSSSTA